MSGELHDVPPASGKDRGGLLIREAGIEDLVAELLDRSAAAVVTLATRDGNRRSYTSGHPLLRLGLSQWATMTISKKIINEDSGPMPFNDGEA